MKVHIRVDMEGGCGATLWDEVTESREGYQDTRIQMTAETAAACRGLYHRYRRVKSAGSDGKGSGKTVKLPERFEVALNFNNHKDGCKASFYPGALLDSARICQFHGDRLF